MLRRVVTNRWLIQGVIVGGLLALALTRIDLPALADAFAKVSYGWLVLALAIYIGSRMVHALEWQITLTKVGKAPFWGLFGVLLIGTLVNGVLPASAGDIVRIQIVANRYGLPRAGLVAGRGAEALVNGVLIVIFVGVSFALPGGAFGSRNLLIWLAVGTVVVMGFSVVLARSLPVLAPQWRVLRYLPKRLRRGVEQHWPRVHEGFEVIRRPKLLVIALAFNVFGWLVDIAISWAFGEAFHLGLPLTAYVSVTLAIGLITIFPITFGNVETFELAVVAALTLHGVSADGALAYAVGIHLFSTVFNIILGLGAMVVMRIPPGELFRLRAPAASAGPIEPVPH
jgi:uncharacterized protein (TIRG00374 family)